MTIDAQYRFGLKIESTPDLGVEADDVPITHTIGDNAGQLTDSTTVPVTKVFSDEASLTAGAMTIDLTGAAGIMSTGGELGIRVNFTGLKVQVGKIVADADNHASTPLVFKVGASNGYNIFGDADGQIALYPGGIYQFLYNDILPDVAAGAKNIDVTGDTTDTFKILLGAG
jgi:hypothetical protein